MILKFEGMTESLRTNLSAEVRSRKFLRRLEQEDMVPHYSKTNSVADQTTQSILRKVYINLGSFPRPLWSLAIYYSIFMKNRLPHKCFGGRSPREMTLSHTNISKGCSRLRPFCQPVYCSDLATKARLVGFTTTWGSCKVILPNRRLAITKNPVRWQPTLSIPVQVQIGTSPAIESGTVSKTEQTCP